MTETPVPTSSTLLPGDLLGRPAESVLDVVTGAPVDRVALYGFGKAALRDGLAAQGYESGAPVVLPALVPHGVVEPIRELGLEPRFYDVDPNAGAGLAPSMADLQSVVEDVAGGPASSSGGSGALVAVHYFGLPQPRFGALADLAAEAGLDLVADNAHGPLSRADGRLLGTRGAFGITSLRKLLPIPDGAALYLDGTSEGAYERVRSPFAGVAADYRRTEATFVARSLAMGIRDRHPVSAGFLGLLGRSGTGSSNGRSAGSAPSAGRDPEAIYRSAKRPMSRLSARVCARTDPDRVVAGRRTAFRAWVGHLGDVPGIEPVYGRLPAGVCPQACPVLAESEDRARKLLGAVPGAHTWPPLPGDVDDVAAFPGAVDLASRLVPLPCHRTVEEAAIHRTAAWLR